MSNEEQPVEPSAWARPGTPLWVPGEITQPPTGDAGDVEELDPAELDPAEVEQTLQVQHRRRRRDWTIAVIVSVVLLLCAGGVVFRNWYVAHASAREQAKSDQWATEQGQKGSWPAAKKVLDGQSAALLRGDEQGWLGAVDPGQPKLRAYYQQIYTVMRALDVSGWEYFVRSPPPYQNWGLSYIELDFDVAYCVAVPKCPQHDPDADPLRIGSVISQHIRLDKVDGVYRIVAVKPAAFYQAAPWQNTKLTFARGKRVVVAAPAGQADRLAGAVAAADKAATVADRFAGYTGYKPLRYRVYLAGDAQWKAWGPAPLYSIGYARPTGKLGTDVVVKMSAVRDRAGLVEILRHEFGHVVTVGGTGLIADAVFDIDSWLEEGVAEYIAYTATPAASTDRVAALWRAGKAPTSLVLAPLSDASTNIEADRLYGYGYLAVSCMAGRYGEANTMRFITAKLRGGESLEQAARHAFGRSFDEVNRVCTAYFRSTVG